METTQNPDGRVELTSEGISSIAGSPLFNSDLAPVAVADRNWTTYNYAALWISMAHCIPTYMMASGLISAGMNWWQALITILLGNVIVLAPILLNSHPGTKYGIPFPVFARASYGVVGSNLPALMRAIVACGWFGIQAWIGGQAIHVFFGSIIPGWNTLLGDKIAGHTPTEWLAFLIFWAMNILVIYRGMNLLRIVENWAAPYVLVMTAVLLAWILYQAGGVGFLLNEPGRFQTFGEFFPIFIPSLTAMIGFWATLSLNMPDFTRFGKSQREQMIGQTVALPTTMVVFAAMGILITSAAVVVFPHMKHEDLWDPVKLVGQFSQPVVVAVSMFTVVVATLSVNIAANVVSPANDFANAFPKLISFRTGGLITGIIGILMQPWKLLADPSGYIFSWLLGYSGGLGSIAGVLIADYWLVRGRNLNLADLYRVRGEYSGWNWRAVAATLLGCFFAWIGLVFEPLKILYDYAWFVGFGVSFFVHWALMKSMPAKLESAENK
ncbi:MAG: NCS1 family nucleobase:cation symporter-1 [Acidobacteria bacterium]|nr:NCS1 family nucleobase:cation symporter-1 [Acidobacteriota bacterium]MBK8813753.1 NCS1 family nucleobase:cation symporter-1 [Acidobacteriota bacterium]